jgi:hypothetical protein
VSCACLSMPALTILPHLTPFGLMWHALDVFNSDPTINVHVNAVKCRDVALDAVVSVGHQDQPP